ncbi:MAG: polysaccharide deacetylase family protein [Flavobacteriales bacterium]|nr:polysaccharide deacetylase family protein [Flavobacteriales bacterium]
MPSVSDLKRSVRDAAARLRMRRDALLGGDCLVLLYHRVAHLRTDPQQLAVAPERFEAQLAWLKRHRRVLTPDEFDAHLAARKRFPRHSALITFDDGYADNHAHARPIMERLGVHGIFYISAGYIGSGREFWWDELERLLLLNNALPRTLLLEHHGVRVAWNLDRDADAGAMRPHYDALLVALRALHSAKREELLSELRGLVHSTNARATHLPMSESELKAFAASPAVTIGAHTLLHCSLAAQSPEEQRREIIGSKRLLEEMLGGTVERFAYPFGTLDDFNEESIRVCKEAGFRHAAANRPGLVHKASPSFAFPRVLVRDWTAEEMADHLRPYQL